VRNFGRAASLAVLVGALFLKGGFPGEAAPTGIPQTLVVTSSVIDAFAQDGGDIAWITRGGPCDSRLHIGSLGAGRTVTIDRIACSDSDQSGPPEELALANGRALWRLTEHFSNQAYGVSIRTAALSDPRVVRLGCCDLEYDPATDDLPSWALAGSGRLLVYYAHSGIYRQDGGAVVRVLGRKERGLFKTTLPLDLAVDRGRIALVRRSSTSVARCGCNFKPVWSPDGTRIAFLRADGPLDDPFGDGDFAPRRPAEIAVMGADGTDITSLTRDRRERSALDWSNDRTKFVYAYLDEVTYGGKIAVANADGSDSHDIAAGSEPEWSPGGSAIAFESGGTVSVVNVDGTGLRELAQGRQPSWSPDGTEIAFVRASGLYVMRSDGTGVRKIAGGEYARDPTWSPDGRRIAYAEGGLFTINADGSGRRLLRYDEDGWHFAPDWSPDGRRLVFSSDRDDRVDDGAFGSEIYVVSAEDGSGLRSLTAPRTVVEWMTVGEIRSSGSALLSSFRSKGYPRAVALSGPLVAVLTQLRTGPNRIALFDARSGASRGVVRVSRNTGSRLAASERWVVFSVGTTIRAIDVRTRATRLLARTRDRPIGLSISGRRVAWAENPDGRGRIRVLSLPR